MADGKYAHQGVDLRPVYELMNEHLRIRRSSLSGGGDFARALVEAGWRPPASRAELRPLPEMLKKWDSDGGDIP